MTWYDQDFASAAWQEFARIFPREAQQYRDFPGLGKWLRPVIEDFFMAYEGR
jgi:hypothetical protein